MPSISENRLHGCFLNIHTHEHQFHLADGVVPVMNALGVLQVLNLGEPAASSGAGWAARKENRRTKNNFRRETAKQTKASQLREILMRAAVKNESLQAGQVLTLANSKRQALIHEKTPSCS